MRQTSDLIISSTALTLKVLGPKHKIILGWKNYKNIYIQITFQLTLIFTIS